MTNHHEGLSKVLIRNGWRRFRRLDETYDNWIERGGSFQYAEVTAGGRLAPVSRRDAVSFASIGTSVIVWRPIDRYLEPDLAGWMPPCVLSARLALSQYDPDGVPVLHVAFVETRHASMATLDKASSRRVINDIRWDAGHDVPMRDVDAIVEVIDEILATWRRS